MTAFLNEHGYRLSFRHDGWTECLIVGPGERFRGSGLSQGEALADAVRKAFPSQAARNLLDGEMERRGAGGATVSTQLEPVSPPPASAPARNVVQLRRNEDATVEDAEEVDELDTGEPQSDASEPGADVEGILSSLRTLRKNIESDKDELGLLAPARQRLIMLGWICAARAYEERCRGESRVFHEVASIARTLAGLCKAWWPGSVRALQLHISPSEVASDLPQPMRVRPTNWADAAALVVQAIDSVEDEDDHQERDEDGWADADLLEPPPENPGRLLAEIADVLRRNGGPLGVLPDTNELPDPEHALRWARQLRWLRAEVEDIHLWGLAMGRLRFWASRGRGRFSQVSQALDAAYRPERPWAELLGEHGRPVSRARVLRELFTEPPKPEDAPSSESLATWLARALAHAETHHTNILEIVAPFRTEVLGLDADTLPEVDRKLRRRLSRLKKDLDPTQGEPAALAPPGPIPSEEEVAAEAAAEEEHTDELPGELLERVLPRVRGKKALLVSRVDEPPLRARLTRLFELEEINWMSSATDEHKLGEALLDQLSSSHAEIVLAATGMHGHLKDIRLQRVCGSSGVTYARVHRAQPAVTLRGLARELGVDSQAQPRAS